MAAGGQPERCWGSELGGLNYCESLALGDQSDWRLPNVRELESIVALDWHNPAINNTTFPGCRPSNYWSSSTYQPTPTNAWMVDFTDGYVSLYSKVNNVDSHCVRCVRGGNIELIEKPTVTTVAVTNIGATTATGNGTVTALGVPNPTQHGVCWNMTGSPTIADSRTEEGAVSATGPFASSMTGLLPCTVYYVRSYATNSAGTGHGSDVSFATTCATVSYVSGDGNCEGKNPCYRTIQEAIDDADTGTCIRVEEGTYPESIVLNASKTVTLQGGYDTSFWAQTADKTSIKAPKALQGSVRLQMLTIKP